MQTPARTTSFPFNAELFPTSPTIIEQIPLIHEVNEDDQLLENSPENE